MKSYLSYFRLRLLNNIQYRAAAIAGISTQVFWGFAYVMVYLALYESNPSANAPMELKQLISYVWLGQAFLALTFIYKKDSELIHMIKNGNLSYELIRPQNFYFKFYLKLYAERIVSCFLRFFPIILLGFLLPEPYNLTLPTSLINFILFLILMILGSFLVVSLSMIVHILTMYLLDQRGLFTVYSVIGDLFMGTIVPLPFLPRILQLIAKYLPFRFITDVPYRIYIGNLNYTNGFLYILISLLWIIITILIGYVLTSRALKRAVIQGG